MTDSSELLTTVLKNVSRAFYLSMRVLPNGVRQPISIAYLLARAADTIADTPQIEVPVRLQRLQFLRDLVAELSPQAAQLGSQAVTWSEGATAGEVKLLQVLPQALLLASQLPPEDRRDVQSVVDTLISGMVLDLSQFPGRFTEMAQLDNYTYLVAGCVGEFWSAIIARHCRALSKWDLPQWSAVGMRFGKALQLTNILRDLVKDLDNGRSYIPGLVREGWTEQISESGGYYAGALKNLNRNQVGDILGQWLNTALDHYQAAIAYTLSLPWHCWLLRLAVIWPIAIGLATLSRLSLEKGWLEKGKRVKVPRSWVYRMLLFSLPVAFCTPALSSWLNSWLERARRGAQAVRQRSWEDFGPAELK